MSAKKKPNKAPNLPVLTDDEFDGLVDDATMRAAQAFAEETGGHKLTEEQLADLCYALESAFRKFVKIEEVDG